MKVGCFLRGIWGYNMRSSTGEVAIYNILLANGIDFAEEYEFDDLVASSGKPLRFDFAVFDPTGDVDFLIEFNGIQHYKPVSKYGGVKGLSHQRFNDAEKRKYCRLHRIPLVVIPYYDEAKISYDYIFSRAGY